MYKYQTSTLGMVGYVAAYTREAFDITPTVGAITNKSRARDVVCLVVVALVGITSL